MSPMTDLLPLDLSTSSGQAIDNKTNLMPSLDLEATFSEFMREPLLADQAPVVELVGEQLPLGGSQLPLEQWVDNGDDLGEVLLGSERNLDPVTPTQTEALHVAVGELPIDASHPIPEDSNEPLPLAVVNPTPTAVSVEEQSRSIELRRQRAEADPFVRQTLNDESGQERFRTSAVEPILVGRQQPLRELQDASTAQIQRSTLDSSLYQGEKLVQEVASNVATSTKIEGGESTLKPTIPFNSIAINGASIDTSQVRSTLTGNVSALPSITTTIDVPVMDKAWGNALQDRVMWMTGRGIQNAEIRLNPTELGPIRVQVSVENDAAQLAFSAQNPITRDAIEQMMPRLREMLSESGLSLGGSTVSDGERPDADRDQDSTGQVAGDAVASSSDEAGEVSASAIREPSPTALIDTFA